MKAIASNVKRKVLNAYKSPKGTIKSIADNFGVSVATVNAWVRVAGLSRGVRRVGRRK